MKRSRARSREAVEFARSQRATTNEFANIVWSLVRNRQIYNQKFRREHPIPPYTADFCCVELKLILEVDGSSHVTATGQLRDRVRDDFLDRQGYRILQLAGYEVLREESQLLEKLRPQVRERMRELGIERD